MFYCVIPGTPIAQKQTRFSCRGGVPRCYDPSSKDKLYIQSVVKLVAPEKPFDIPVEIQINFFMPIPKSTPKALREKMISYKVLPDKKPDDDNLSYLVTNALKGLVYDDDKRICRRYVTKLYAEQPSTFICVAPIILCD